MLDTDRFGEPSIDATTDERRLERGRTLEERVLDLLDAEFSGVIRSHIRGEVYGGC